MRRHVLERWLAALGGCALAGSFYLYTALAVRTDAGPPVLEPLIREVVAGQAAAPYQYRVLVPALLVWLSDHTALSMGQAIVLVDGTALAVGAATGFALLRRSGVGLYALYAGFYCTFMSIGLAFLPKPETVTAFACTTVALVALGRRPVASGWWSPAVVWSSFAIATAVLAGCRTDLVFALAVGFAVRYRRGREPADAIAMVTLAVVAVGASLALIVHYRHAHYPAGVGIVQIGHNLDALPIVAAALFLLPALAPLVLLWRYPEVAPRVRPVVSDDLPLLGVILTAILAVLVVGRIDEVRLLFPVAFALAWVGVDLWRAVIASFDVEETPVA